MLLARSRLRQPRDAEPHIHQLLLVQMLKPQRLLLCRQPRCKKLIRQKTSVEAALHVREPLSRAAWREHAKDRVWLQRVEAFCMQASVIFGAFRTWMTRHPGRIKKKG